MNARDVDLTRPLDVADAMQAVEAQTQEWPDEPESLDAATASAPYPLDALPGIVGAAVTEYLAYGQQPPALVASSALAAVALSVQGLANVVRDSQLIGPLSLNLLIVAQSGERKSAADGAFTAALSRWERERRDALAEPLKRNKADRVAWVAERKGIEAAITQAVKSGKGDMAKLKATLSEHATKEPAELILPRLRYEDCNPESLAHALTKGHPSAALWSDEAGLVVGSHGMGKDSMLRFMGFLNRMWDGGDFHQDRKIVESTSVEGRRFSCCLMMQSEVLRSFLDGSKGLSRGSGFLARYLICEPASTISRRPYREPDATPKREAFNQRIRAVLDRPMPMDDEGRLHLPILSMTPDAKAVWTDYFNRTEKRLGAYGDLDSVRDFASKSAENAARIAGSFHIFEGGHGKAIDAATTAQAVRLAGWYLEETLRLLNVLDEPQRVGDARLLDEWLNLNAPDGSVNANTMLQEGPNRLRTKARRDAALAVLIDKNRVVLQKDGRQRIIVRHPHLVHAENHSQRTATAIPAIPATDGHAERAGIATVAGIAVATSRSAKTRIPDSAASSWRAEL